MQQSTLDYLNKVCDALDKTSAQIRKETDEIVATNDHVEIIKHFVQVRAAAETIKVARDAIKGIEDTLSRTIIPDVVANLETRTGEKPPFNIEGVGRVSVPYRFSCSMIDKNMGVQWLKENGHGDIVQETVNSNTLGSFARNMLEVEGKELPDDYFKISMSPYTSITKAR